MVPFTGQSAIHEVLAAGEIGLVSEAEEALRTASSLSL
jgi:hypothetical protein